MIVSNLNGSTMNTLVGDPAPLSTEYKPSEATIWLAPLIASTHQNWRERPYCYCMVMGPS
jgi:hypothetical protein